MSKKILVTGGTGLIGKAVEKISNDCVICKKKP